MSPTDPKSVICDPLTALKRLLAAVVDVTDVLDEQSMQALRDARREAEQVLAGPHVAYTERVEAPRWYFSSLDALRDEYDAATPAALRTHLEDHPTGMGQEASRAAILSRLFDEDTVQVAADAARNDRKGWHPDVLRRALVAVARHLENPVPK